MKTDIPTISSDILSQFADLPTGASHKSPSSPDKEERLKDSLETILRDPEFFRRRENIDADPYNVECCFLQNFITEEMEREFPMVAREFLKHEFQNIPGYRSIYGDDTPEKIGFLCWALDSYTWMNQPGNPGLNRRK